MRVEDSSLAKGIAASMFVLNEGIRELLDHITN